MASPMVPGEDPSEFEMDGRTGAKILISTDTRKESMKRSARGLMGRYTFLRRFSMKHPEDHPSSGTEETDIPARSREGDSASMSVPAQAVSWKRARMSRRRGNN